MPLTANQGAAWNISDCFILSSGIAFLKNCTITVGQHFCMKNIFHLKITLKNGKQESFHSIMHNQITF